MRCPVIHICIWYVIGLFLSYGLTDVLRPNVLLLFAVILFFLCAFVFCHWKSLQISAYFSMAVICLLVGWGNFLRRYESVRCAAPQEEGTFIGRVLNTPTKKPKTWAMKLRSENHADVLLYLKVSTPPSVGDILKVRPLTVSYTCPADAEDREFVSYQRYLFYTGVCASVYADSMHCMSVGKQGESAAMNSSVIRKHLSEAYRKEGIVGDEAALIEAITLGEKQNLTKSMREEYSRAGVSHILALSGYHLTFIYVLLEMLFLGRLVILRWRWISRLAVLLCLWVFAWIAGMPPSLLRATIMISVMIVSGIFYRYAISLNSLALSALLILLVDPFLLMDIGFQLSYVSMIGILTVGVPLTYRLQPENCILAKLVPVVVITLTCSVFTAPLVAYYFHQIPLLSVVSNLVLTVLVPLVMLTASVWWMMLIVPSIQVVVTSCLVFLVSVMNSVVSGVASVEWATVSWRPNLLGLILFYILLCSLIGIFHYLCKLNKLSLIFNS